MSVVTISSDLTEQVVWLYMNQALMVTNDLIFQECLDSTFVSSVGKYEAGFMSRPVPTIINELIPFRNCQHMELTCSKSLSKRLINIPSSSGLISDN